MRSVLLVVVVVALQAILVAEMAAGQADPNYEMMRGNQTQEQNAPPSNQTAAPPPSNTTQPPAPTTTTTPTTPPAGNLTSGAQLDADVWVESWYKRNANIYRVDPDGIRERSGRTARMYSNFSVMMYVKDHDTPFSYDIKVNGITANKGQSTWKLAWATEVPEANFNLTVTIVQNGQLKYVEWAHVVASKKDDTGGLNGEETPGVDEALVKFTPSAYAWMMFYFFGSAAAVMGATFYLVGGYHLERMERLGWTRWMG